MSTWPRRWRSSGRRNSFDCKFANVQPNSGSQMNQAVFLALLKPGDTFMGLDLNSGGHLTHGSPVNMSGKWFNVVSYGVRQQDQRLDMDDVRAKALEHRPKLIIAGGTAYSARMGLGGVPRHRRRDRRLSACRHGPYRRSGGGWGPCLALAACACRDDDDAQKLARSAWRHDPDERRRDRQEDEFGGLPGASGRAPDACDRGQGRGLWRGAGPIVQGLCGPGQEECRRHGGRVDEGRHRHRVGRVPTTTCAWPTCAPRR